MGWRLVSSAIPHFTGPSDPQRMSEAICCESSPLCAFGCLAPPLAWAGARKAKPSCWGHCSPSEVDLESRRKLETTTQ